MKAEICEKVEILLIVNGLVSAQVQLGVAVPSRHFSGLWQNCVVEPPDLQLISQVDF